MVNETQIILDLDDNLEEKPHIEKNVLESVTITSKPYSGLDRGFHMLPNEIHIAMTLLGLKPNEKLVYLYLVRLAHNSGLPFPSYQNIMDNTGISTRNTLANVLRSLEEKNLIRRVSRGNSHGVSNTYQVSYLKYSKKYEERFEF